ncbi:MAG: DNA polymerase III subunit delta [Ignavibacteria bacterium]|nr:DNA polymerase III subunit delta [Ignavibacteria bacterium]
MIEFNKFISRGNFTNNLFFFFGNEQFLVFDAYQQVRNRLVKEYKVEILVFDAEEEKSKEKLIDSLLFLRDEDFFLSKKLLVIKNIEKIYPIQSKKKKLDNFDLVFAEVLETKVFGNFIVVLSYDDKLSGLAKELSKNKNACENFAFPFDFLFGGGAWFEFPKLSQQQIRSWLSKELARRDIVAEPAVVDFLLENSNFNLWELNSELEKIKSYLGEKKNLSISELTKIHSNTKETNVFEIISFVAQKDLDNSIKLVQLVIKKSHQELLLLSLLLKFFKNLLFLFDEIKTTRDRTLLAKSIGVQPYFMNDYFEGIQNYSKKEAEKAINYIVQADFLLKSSTIDPVNLLVFMLSKIIKPNEFYGNA